MSQIDIVLALAAGIVMLLGLWSKPIKKSVLQEPVIALAIGVGVGPYGLGWLDLATWGDGAAILREAARLTMAVGLVAVALSIDTRTIARLWRPLTLLLTLGMVGMWLVASGLAMGFLALPLWTALLLGAIVAPTDPIVAASIVSGAVADRHLPRRLRDTISFESGANDGLAYAIVMLPILMIAQPADTAWTEWLVDSLLVGTLGAAAIGGAVGFGAARLLAHAKRRKLIERHSFLSYTIALSLLTLGISTLIGAEALISVFLAGLVFNACTDSDQAHEEENVQEAIANLLTLPMFALFGLAAPVEDWIALGWPLAGVVGAIILLRRVPVVLAMARGFAPLTLADTIYAAWFGPIGFAAIYYAIVAAEAVGDPNLWTLASAIIFGSIVVHGMTATPFTRLYGRVTRRAD